jgi:predicted GNAT family N-acyltransferase
MKFEFIKNDKISKDLVLDIIKLKNIHWQYTIEQHLDWINKNINPNDIHVIMRHNQELVGYLNLVQLNVKISDSNYDFYGIGNVCVKEKAKGYGKMLIDGVNEYLMQENFQGILLCKDSLVDFYSKCTWQLMDKNKVEASFDLLNTMVFNLNSQMYDKTIFIEKQF